MALSLSDIERVFLERGHRAYDGEPVSHLTHALQTATLAEQNGATPELVAACLLHDLGHLLADHPDTPTLAGIDDKHQYFVLPFLRGLFGSGVLEPIRLHVEAKRYLAAREPDYIAGLSPASAQSLRLQGGPMSPAEAEAFEALPAFDAAVKLRRYDERGKAEGVTIAPLLAYRDLLIGLVSSG